ncbi:MAG: YraN family protein [Verrucomicrobiota bacterium]|nr:YraN family protein [Verrucomicrobiota bacterium]
MKFAPLLSLASFSSKWRSAPAKKTPPHLALGARGEKLARRFLRQQGYKILYRNFRARRGGEVDLVCRDDQTLVFVEVKTRSSENFGRPFDAVNLAKQKLIARGALAWLDLLGNPDDILWRFDVVEIVLANDGAPKFELLRDAFPLPAPLRY